MYYYLNGITVKININNLLQLTTETYGEAVSDLASIIGETEESTGNQTDKVLDTVADYFTTLTTFINQPNVTSNASVSLKLISLFYIL